MKKCFPLAILLIVFLHSCKKESFITGREALLFTSEDTLHFDTVFTSVGSVTHYFKIYNTNNQKLRISNVQLKGGAASFFRMNVDGYAGTDITDLEMEPNDSMYVFVTVKIDPSTDNLPFVVQDSIRIAYNGNERWVQLQAWGQNARFFRTRFITADETWDNQKPYVLLGGLLIAPNATLTIEKGTRIHLHADAPLIVEGTLLVKGEKHDSTRVVFEGDRLDEPYKHFPGAWPGIYFMEKSKNNVMEYAVIKNAYQGIVSDQPSVNTQPKVLLKQCIIDNCYDAGILGFRGSVSASNCLVSNCGKNIVLAYGGNYEFTHCTSVAFSNLFLTHKDPSLYVSDFVKNGNTILTSPLNASFTNCIFWGDYGTVENEVVTGKQGSGTYSVRFDHSLWKVKSTPSNVTSTNMIANQYPLFDSVNTSKRYFNFRLREGSPAINKGAPTALPFDLDGRTRSAGIPDLGCYERQ